MGKKLVFRRIIKIIISCCVSIVFLFAVGISVARVALPKLDDHKQKLGDWLSHIVHQKIVIKDVSAAWYRFTPYVQFKDVYIGDKTSESSPIHVGEVDVALDLWDSILARAPRPGSLIIKGAHLSLKEQDGKFVIYGMQQHGGHNQSGKVPLTKFVSWMLRQADINISDLSLNVFFTNHTAMQTKDLNLHSFSRDGKHRLVFNASLKQMIPTKIYLVADIDNADDAKHYNVKFYGDADNILSDQVLQFVHANIPQNIKISHGDVSADFWGSMSKGKLQQLHALMHAKNIGVQKNKYSGLISLLHANLLWQHRANGWNILADNIKAKVGSKVVNDVKFGVQHFTAADGVHNLVAMSGLHMQDIFQVLRAADVLTTKIDNKYANLKLYGLVNHFYLSDVKGKTNYWQAQADINNFSINHLRRNVGSIPDISPVDLSLYADPNSGSMTIVGNKVKFYLHQVYSHDLKFNSLNATANWHKQNGAWLVNAPAISILAKDTVANANLEMKFVPQQSPYINLLANGKVTNADVARNYIPNHHLSGPLIKWLQQAFLSGYSNDCTVLFHGKAGDFPFNNHSGRFEVAAKVNDLTLRYSPNWPDLVHANGDLLFDDSAMHLVARTAEISGMHLTNVTADIPNLRRAVLNINGDGSGAVANGLNFLTNTPLLVGKYLAGTKAKGNLTGKLSLSLPLFKQLRDSKINGAISANNIDWYMPAWSLHLRNASGDLNFNQDSLTAQGIKANLLGGPTSIDIKTANKRNGSDIDIEASGKANVADIKNVYKVAALHFAKGVSDYNADLHLDTARYGNDDLKITSSLQGVSVALPGMLHKDKDQQGKFLFDAALGNPKILPMKLTYNNIFKANMVLGLSAKETTLRSAIYKVGNVDNHYKLNPGMIVAYINLPKINWDTWQNIYNEYLKQAEDMGQSTAAKNNMQMYVATGDLTAFNYDFKNININAASITNGWRAYIKQKDIDGLASWVEQSDKLSIFGKFSKLKLNPTGAKSKTNKITVTDLPAIDFTCDKGSIGKYDFANLHILGKPNSNGSYKISDLSIEPPYSKISLHGMVSKKNIVTLTGEADTNDLGSFMHAWGYGDFIAKTIGSGKVNLSWDDNILSPKLKDLDMDIKLALWNGRFLEIGKEAQSKLGLGRLLNFFSLQSIPQRLTFNFSDLSKKGFKFSSLKSRIDMVHGVMHINSATVKGPVATVHATGIINLLAKKCNVKMSVAPDVTSSAPIIATIAGGPIVGAFTWVANKIVSPSIGKALLVKYRIKGPLANPQVTEVSGGHRHKNSIPKPV